MAAFRVLGQFVQYFLDNGQVNDGGSVTFYETDLTTLKNTYTDPTLTVPNSNPVVLTADGRLSSDAWGDGEYGAELKDADGVVLEALNNIQSGADAGFVIPALVAGAYLTNDGSNLQWDNDVAAQLLPDMTGEAGNILYTDGTISYWDAPPDEPDIPEPEVIIVASTVLESVQLGTSADPTKDFVQFGADVAPANPGGKTTSKAVVFDEPFATVPFVTVTNNTGFVNGGDVQPSIGAIAVTTTGFTAQFGTQLGEGNSDSNIIVSINFTYRAEGTKEVP